jgi:hypothetical protein
MVDIGSRTLDPQCVSLVKNVIQDSRDLALLPYLLKGV